MIPPIAFRWTGEAMVPSHQVVADRHFVIGERYTLIQHEERSQASHAHFFACVADVWQNLPEAEAERFSTAEHLRKWCLIKAGYRDERTIVASSKAEAQRIAAFIKPMDEFAIVTVSEATVVVYTAKSQSLKAMGKREFQASKDAVLQIAAEMIGAQPDQLGRAA